MTTKRIMHPVRITNGPACRPSSEQMSIYQVNTCREDLSWLHFEDEPKVQESK